MTIKIRVLSWVVLNGLVIVGHLYRLSFHFVLDIQENLDIINYHRSTCTDQTSFKITFPFLFSPHPYLFFNEDHITMTFLGFSINSNGDLVDPQASTILDRGLMPKRLTNGLRAQGVDFTVKSESWSK